MMVEILRQSEALEEWKHFGMNAPLAADTLQIRNDNGNIEELL